MPNTQVGNQVQYAYAPEVILGVPVATPAGQIVRWIPGTDSAISRSFTKNPEIRSDYMTAPGVAGGMRAKHAIAAVMSFGSYDDWLGYALGCAAWNANIVKVRPFTSSGAISLASDSVAKTFTRTVGSFVTDGFVVGDIVLPNGFTTPANNTAFVVTAVSALVITCGAATTIVTEVAAAGRSLTLDIHPGFTFERGDKGVGNYLAFPGTVVDNFDISGKSGSNAQVDIKFNLISKIVSNENPVSVFTTLVQPNGNDLLMSWTGSVKKGAVSILNVVGWDIKVARNSDSAEVCASPDLYDINPKAAVVTGKLDIWFDSIQFYNDFRLQTDVTFQLNLGPGGSKSYTLDFNRCRITKWGAPPKDGLMSSTIEWESNVPLAGGTTSIQITRIP